MAGGGGTRAGGAGCGGAAGLRVLYEGSGDGSTADERSDCGADAGCTVGKEGGRGEPLRGS